MTKLPNTRRILHLYLAVGIFLSALRIFGRYQQYLLIDDYNEIMDQPTRISSRKDDNAWIMANSTEPSTLPKEGGVMDTIEHKRPWIIADADRNATRDCVRLHEMSSAIVRISLHQFMHNENSPGHPFLPLYQYIKTHYDPHNAVEGIPGVTPSIRMEVAGFGWVRDMEECWAYALHNFKVGGTALLAQQQRLRQENIRLPVFANRRLDIFRSQQPVSTTTGERNDNSNPPRYETGVFSFVRDPVSRFVSAVRQVVQLDRCGDCRPCIKRSFGSKNSTQLISCLLDVMETQHSYLDRHLTPQVFTLYHALGKHDIYVDLMDLSDLDSVLDGLFPTHRLARDDTVVNANTGVTRGFNVSGVSILPPVLIRRVCRMYEVDLRLLRETGLLSTTMTTTLCDDPRYRSDDEPWIPRPPTETTTG